jgi:hypothetical protein
MKDASSPCTTCYGTGEVVNEQGAMACPDCFGDGGGAKIEWHLRELERRYAGTGETAADVQWLIHEVRRCRETLIRILTLSQDADESDELARRIKFQVNEALALYPEDSRSK